MGSTTSQRLGYIDALRGIAAGLVVACHYALASGGSFDAGALGVDLFFVISGFVILMTVDRMPRRTDFFVGRFARLYPTFLLGCAVTTLVVQWHGILYFERAPAEYLANLTMAADLFGARWIDPSYWSLMYELVFYLLCMLGWRWIKRGRAELLCAVWLAWQVASVFVATPEWLRIVTAAPYANLFIIGMIVYRIRAKGIDPARLALIGAAIGFAALSNPYDFLTGGERVAEAAVLASVIFIASNPVAVPSKFLRPLVYLGEISYPLYLMHQVIGGVFIATLTQRGVPALAAVAIVLGPVVLLADCAHRWVEVPGRRLLRRARSRPAIALWGLARPAASSN